MNECGIYFFKEGIKGLAFKGISHITGFSEASVPLIIGLSITRPNWNVGWGRGAWGEVGGGLGWQLGISTGETQHWVFLIHVSVSFLLKK